MFANKVVVVTGASSGIGAATALLFAKEGADVAIVARTQAKLEAVAKQCAAHGKKPLIIKADLSKEAETATVIPKTIKQFGKIDVLVNNAGIIVEGALLDGKALESYDTVMKTNVRAVVQLTMLAAPHLVKTKGNVINISSGAGKTVCKVPSAMAYYMSKATLDHFTRCAALELASSGVRVNGINPGPVDNDFSSNNGFNLSHQQRTDATAQGFMATNEEIGGLIAKEVVARTQAKLEAVAKQCAAHGKKPLIIKADLTVCKLPNMMAYYVSKAALELASSGVRVNGVNPGPVDNDFPSNNGFTNLSQQDLINSTALGFMAKALVPPPASKR